jgi:hypothetical protein
MNISIRPAQVARAIALMAVMFAVLSLSLRLFEFLGGMHPTRKFDLDTEGNIPNYISALLLMLSAGIVGVVAYVKRTRDDRFRRHWAALACIFAFLSLDEAAALHEVMNRFFKTRLHVDGVFHYAWVVGGLAFVVLFVAFMSKFLLHLEPRFRKLLIASGALYVGGALGIEMVGAKVAANIGTLNVPYHLFATAEELCEFLGIALLIYTVLEYLANLVGEVSFSFIKQESLVLSHSEPEAARELVLDRRVAAGK